MAAYPSNARVAAYQSTAVHGGVAAADQHGLVLMLLNAAVERISTASGCIERREFVRKAKLLHSCVTIVGELRGSLNMTDGGDIAENLSDLYDYIVRLLLRANGENHLLSLAEALGLLCELRSAWVAIGPQVRRSARPVPGA